MIQEYQIRILPEQAASEEGIKRYLAKEKGLDVRTLNQVRVLKRSIDARQRTIFVNLKVRAYINEFPQDDQYIHTEYPDVSSRPRVILVGEGPGGLFASLRLIELGYRPIVLERGKDVRERKKDLSNITKTQKVDGRATTVSVKVEPVLIVTANSIPEARKGKCRQDSERILPAWCQYQYPGRCPSAYRYRQVATRH